MKLTEKLLKEEIEKVMSEGFADFFRGRKRGPTGKGDTPGGAGQQVTFKDEPTPEEELAAMQKDHRGGQDAAYNDPKMQAAEDDLERSGLTGLDTMGGGGGGSAYVGSYRTAVNNAIRMADQSTNIMDVAGKLLMKMAPNAPMDQLRAAHDEIRSYLGRNAKRSAVNLSDNGRDQMAMGLKAAANMLGVSRKNESITLSSDDIRKMIQEELINISKGK